MQKEPKYKVGDILLYNILYNTNKTLNVIVLDIYKKDNALTYSLYYIEYNTILDCYTSDLDDSWCWTRLEGS